MAGALAYLLALRVGPDPWAIGAALAVGLSAPALAYGTAVYPELVAGCALAGAALLALRLYDNVSRRVAFGCFAPARALPWLGVKYVPAGVVIGVFAVRALLRERRRTLAIGASELAIFSLALFVGISQGFFGGADAVLGGTARGETPPAPRRSPTTSSAPTASSRCSATPTTGCCAGRPCWCSSCSAPTGSAARARRGCGGRSPPTPSPSARGSCAARVLVVQLLVAAFLAPDANGFWFPGRQLVAALPLAVPLVAWGLRHNPRIGTALSWSASACRSGCTWTSASAAAC